MPASVITLRGVTALTPEGHSLFSQLNLSLSVERTGLVGRNGVGKSTLLRLMAGDLRPDSGSIDCPLRLGWLRQGHGAATRGTVAALFGIGEDLARLARIEAGHGSLGDFSAADWTLPARFESAIAGAGLAVAADTSIDTLSGGQRTRLALAALLFKEPQYLLLDEPTNDLDRDGRRAVLQLLADWNGGALVVSHDRELLGEMDSIVELTSLGATRYGGNWQHYRAQKQAELTAIGREVADARKQLAAVQRSTQQRLERKARTDGAGRRKRARGDAPKILLDAQKQRSEASGGSSVRLGEARQAEAEQALQAARQKVEVQKPVVVELASSALAAGKTVLTLEAVNAGYDLRQPVLQQLSLALRGPERVALVGPNGAGKSTLLALVAGELEPFSGSVACQVDCARLDQRAALLQAHGTVLESFCRYHPGLAEGACREALARLGFRAAAALQPVASLSGGERLRAALACVLGGPRPPQLLLLDEPTNHLDLEAIAALEAGLGSYDGALLVASHDQAFLQAIGIERYITLGG
ncbi:ABC-F family ATP-binding cassette domain-containing protein [Parahaliea mediterranea]|uniref:ABC-F family ATP-binding cassette domain-containing protein n=1 Tax=Parahaliea mediterranea TaxID=651086 RepID=UPI000E2FA514|nr:ABC-F family ATP-binding cassette domain-containing protein [Parahaliea mediterranea]